MRNIFRKIALVVLFLMLIFLSLGLFFPKVTYETKGEVNISLEETFSLYNDIEQLKEWIPDVKAIEKIKETPDKIGSEYRMVVENNGQEMEMLETVIDFVPNEKVALYIDAGMMLKNDVFTFTSEEGKTIINGYHEVEGSTYYSKCVFAFFKGPFRTIDQGYLDNFITWAEEE